MDGNLDTTHPGRWWRTGDDGKIICELCPRYCRLREGQRGFCFVRSAQGGQIVSTTYGRSSGFCIDPIEKKPLNHFHPGTAVLSFGTAGCNLGCRYCQNWDVSKARQFDRLADTAMPGDIAETARREGCASVAFTYNDPIIFAEYALDTAAACRERGIHPVAVTSGYITDWARAEFFAGMDAVNVDLKGFSENFYKTLCLGHMQPVLDTLEYLARETDVWLEITTLLIPGWNDSEPELNAMTEWIADRLGPDVPLHFTAFHPDYKMVNVRPTPPATLQRARKIALAHGLNYVYTGNVHNAEGDATWCPGCETRLIQRDWYEIVDYNIVAGCCPACGERVKGHFDKDGPGEWGRRRKPVRIGPHAG